VLGTVGLGAALLLMGGGAAVLADNPELTGNARLYKLSADANRDAERAIARARKARGAERARELDEAERLVRQAVEYGRQAGQKWLSYETSQGKEEIDRLRGRADNTSSYYSKRGDRDERRARLLRGALEDVKRLEEAKRQGWDVEEDLARARRYVEAFSKQDNPTSVARAQRLIRQIADRDGVTLEQAARRFASQHPAAALDVMDRIGSWPSSEPELAALQRVF
jgi:hypothetical protein